MQPYEIRTVPARVPVLTVIGAVCLLGLILFCLGLGVQTTVVIARSDLVGPSKGAMVGASVLLLLGLAWYFLRSYVPRIQIVGMYLFRDRGKQVVAYRLDATGWHHVVAGSDVGVPWEGMTAAVTERADGWFRLQVTSDGPFTAGRDPYSRELRRTLRKERGFSIPMTDANPTEVELASAIAQQSAGRVELAR
jgi:hypothetical protein